MLPTIRVLKPSGILDRKNADKYSQQVNELLEKGINIILIDLKNVTLMDSSGLGTLVLILKKVNASGGKLFLKSVNDQVQMLFELTNMIDIFNIVQDQEELQQKLAKLNLNS